MSEEVSTKSIVIAGGCFWGAEKAINMLEGVLSTRVGYANGHTENPTYEEVCKDNTGYKEAVEAIYDPSVLSLDTILKAFFLFVNPAQKNQQGNDVGSQYQSGIYYTNEEDKEIIEAYFEEEKKTRNLFFVECEPLQNFYEAEEYHQKYLDKVPGGYCHVTTQEFEAIQALNKKR